MAVFIIGIVIVIVLMIAIGIYEPHFDVVQDVDLNKVLIMWYNKYTSGGVIRQHKILYDTGRNKK
jgi:hypothetical protein